MRALFLQGAIALGLAVRALAQAPGDIQDVLKSWQKSPYANYPTQFTRDIIPVCACYFIRPQLLSTARLMLAVP